MTDAQEIIAPNGKALIAEAITDYFGERCDGFETTCMTCQAWASWDRILGPDEVDQVTVVRPLDEWHEDFGDAVWWTWEGDQWLGEPSYIGTPNDSDWPGYHTHWSQHPPFPPRALTEKRDE